MKPPANELTVTERNDLQYCEQQIEKGLQTFIEVGEALWKIREGKLYREAYGTFEAYCKERWGITKQRAYQLMDASDIGKSTMVDSKPAITSERQARELAKVEPERRQEVVEKVMERDGKVTARAIREAERGTGFEEPSEPQPFPKRKKRAAPFNELQFELEFEKMVTRYAKRFSSSRHADLFRIMRKVIERVEGWKYDDN